jgi:RNA polymerase sigma factor (TIGR02999 family)
MSEITVILERLGRGEQDAFDELVPLVYQELRRRAGGRLARSNGDQTLQPTALVNEAFLKLMADQPRTWQNSRHFYNAAAEVMRQIVLNHARENAAQKRGGHFKRIELEGVEPVVVSEEPDWEALDRGLSELRDLDQRRHQVVMLRFFAGLTNGQIAQVLEVSEKTVERDWAAARAFLRAAMDGRHS